MGRSSPGKLPILRIGYPCRRLNLQMNNQTDELTARPKILYIDDLPEARALVVRILAKKYIVLEADNSLHGIELAADTNPDLILLDLNLPDMSGYELATRFASLHPDTPLVALTAEVSSQARERALIAGCQGVITKPIDIDQFPTQVERFLGGEHEKLQDSEQPGREYQAWVVRNLEQKVRELSAVIEKNAYLDEQNRHIIKLLKRRQRLLEAAARIGRMVTSILDLDQLLSESVEIICSEFDYYYAAIYLLVREQVPARKGQQLILKLRAGRGEAGQKQIAAGRQLNLKEDSIVAAAARSAQVQLIPDFDPAISGDMPVLPETRSQLVLPLLFKSNLLGVLSVHSQERGAFADEDVTALQALADQLAVAINNASVMQDLESANLEILRTKTFEAIATATGEAIHWVGNRAAPIPASVRRLREDILGLSAMMHALLREPDHRFGEVLLQSLADWSRSGVDLERVSADLNELPDGKLQIRADLLSMQEDLEIIEHSAAGILEMKEDLIGPARRQNLEILDVARLLARAPAAVGLPDGVVQFNLADELPPVRADEAQLNRVFTNLIKNAWEALDGHPAPRITVTARPENEVERIRITVADNGPGIPAELEEKIWVSFFTTKGHRGGTGLGLAACLEIVTQYGGKIWAERAPQKGAEFILVLPAARPG